MKNNQVTIEQIDDKSPYLENVIALGDAHKKTLSFFRRGAFIDQAKRRQIIVAFDKSQFIGYLLYTASHEYKRIKLIHLCIDPSHRDKGIARQLVNYLIKLTDKEYNGIGLTCRRDYNLHKMWSSLGFVVQYAVKAKTPGKINDYWWLDYGHPDLFSMAANNQRESKLFVVIDADIFFEINTKDCQENEESKVLLSDWVQTDLELCLPDEIFNIIHTINNFADREKKRYANQAKKFLPLRCDTQKSNQNISSLQEFFKKLNIILNEVINESDLRYLAKTIASDVHIFVTHNQFFLNIVDQLYEEFKLSVVTPKELIIRLDDLRQKSDYQPVRFAGTSLEKTIVTRGQENILNDYFHHFKSGESKAEFQQRLRRFITETDKFECWVIRELEGQKSLLALVVYDRHKKHELEIPLLRMTENNLSFTLAHHLIFYSRCISARENRQFTRITDSYLQKTVIKAIEKDMFVQADNGWLKANIAVAATSSDLSQYLLNLADLLGHEYDFCSNIANILKNENEILNNINMVDIVERFLWPIKIINADIPTYILPIQPQWAEHLFDEGLAKHNLWGANQELALNREAVYYRSKTKAGIFKYPGRILWYISKGKNRDGCYTVESDVAAVRACSRLEEIIIDNPKDLFRRFQRLGVYNYKNVLEVAKNDENNDIMAIVFSDTEMFKKPISLTNVQKILGNKSTIQAPIKISKEQFTEIYTLGNQFS